MKVQRGSGNCISSGCIKNQKKKDNRVRPLPAVDVITFQNPLASGREILETLEHTPIHEFQRDSESIRSSIDRSNSILDESDKTAIKSIVKKMVTNVINNNNEFLNLPDIVYAKVIDNLTQGYQLQTNDDALNFLQVCKDVYERMHSYDPIRSRITIEQLINFLKKYLEVINHMLEDVLRGKLDFFQIEVQMFPILMIKQVDTSNYFIFPFMFLIQQKEHEGNISLELTICYGNGLDDIVLESLVVDNKQNSTKWISHCAAFMAGIMMTNLNPERSPEDNSNLDDDDNGTFTVAGKDLAIPSELNADLFCYLTIGGFNNRTYTGDDKTSVDLGVKWFSKNNEKFDEERIKKILTQISESIYVNPSRSQYASIQRVFSEAKENIKNGNYSHALSDLINIIDTISTNRKIVVTSQNGGRKKKKVATPLFLEKQIIRGQSRNVYKKGNTLFVKTKNGWRSLKEFTASKMSAASN